MKKYFFILISLFLLVNFNVYGKNVDNRIFKVDNLNSKNLLSFLKEIEVDSNAIKVCNQDYCDYLKYDSLEKSVNVYIDDYIEHLQEKTDAETSVKVLLQGFLIKDIYFY